MKYVREHKMAVVFSTLACLLILSGLREWRAAPVAAASSGGNQSGTKAVDIEYFPFPAAKFDAVKITKVTVAGQQLQLGLSTGAREDQPGTPFQADEDWLKNMSISLRNRTDKAIVCAQIELWFPEIGDGSAARPTTKYTITVGQRPEWSRHLKGGMLPADPTKKPLLFGPGETIVVPVGEYLAEIQSAVEQKMLQQVTRVNISRGNFYFADGMRWDAVYRGYYVPEPGQPGHYTKLDDSYFPGKLD
jgi:hypothetical protein